jgi:hypothetical protein
MSHCRERAIACASGAKVTEQQLLLAHLSG